MDNLLVDETETHAKISDSAYSNSCSNSQSRRSHSSKSTHSGSHSSGSSGYGGKPLAYSDKSGEPAEKRVRDKDGKKKKQVEKSASEIVTVIEESVAEQVPPVEVACEDRQDNVKHTSPSPQTSQVEKASEQMEIPPPEHASTKDEVGTCSDPLSNASAHYVTSRAASVIDTDGFSCVISMQDGVVMYTTSSLTTTLGFPKEMWIGRSFIDFVHPRDRNTFASHITSGLAVPKNVNGTLEEAPSSLNSVCTMVCRIRRYRSLFNGFAVKERVVTFMPFLLKLSFKNICEDESKAIYLVIQATPFFSAFKTPNEIVKKPIPFVIRHAANGNLEYIDPESVPYLGYLPQDLADKDALQLYHVDDLPYLRQIYEAIVKEGGISRSKPYRMMAQNGDSLKVETEWSSFINPWSRKLEFVIGKHQIIEGPANPDVFQTPPEEDKSNKSPETEKSKSLRESIIRIMNEVLTKPAEVAKQQMTKRCHDLASFMESLMEEPPKNEDELRLEIHDADNSNYERDSVMLGGISPHHDHNDSQSSTETPLSYKQLNYNETLQRYFNSHQPCPLEDYNTVSGENVYGLKKFNVATDICLSPVAQQSQDFGEMSPCESGATIGSSSPDASLADYMKTRLTESLLNKHNAKMENMLMKTHRETRSNSKCEREKVVIETRLKKKQHLARCNAAFQPTAAGAPDQMRKPHGVKRLSKQVDVNGTRKHHCPSARQPRRRQSTSAPAAHISSTFPSSTATANPWANPMNSFILGLGIPQQLPIMNPITAVPVHCMMYGQAMYASPFMYSPMNASLAYPLAQNLMTQTVQSNPMGHSLGLASSNYKEACKQSLPKTKNLNAVSLWKEKKLTSQASSSSKTGPGGGGDSSCSSNTPVLNRSTEAEPNTSSSENQKKSSEETVDRTDGESSYSSFYSSFFKTESGSAEESGDARKNHVKISTNTYYQTPNLNKIARRKTDPPWMEQMASTPELVYKYQVLTKNLDEVLKADQIKISKFEQPSLVNEQLGQLYLDLQLEGVAARLTLEEGITGSSSSEEEISRKTPKPTMKIRRKREYSKLVMIYEEDAPLPPIPEDESMLKHSVI